MTPQQKLIEAKQKMADAYNLVVEVYESAEKGEYGYIMSILSSCESELDDAIEEINDAIKECQKLF